MDRLVIAAPQKPDPADFPPPKLREDLNLHPGPPTSQGAPTFTIEDPARGAFFRIGLLEKEIFLRNDAPTFGAALRSLNNETALGAQLADVLGAYEFARRSELVCADRPDDAARLAAAAKAKRLSLFSQALKHYLFLRIPLWRPNRFLDRVSGLTNALFTKRFGVLALVVAGIGFHLVVREWSAFIQAITRNASPQGALYIGAALLFAKIVHEFGHALVAKRFGLTVPTMGVALMCFYPVLWTDLTQTWRLADKRKRIMVDASGVLSEMLVAALASIFWAVLPPGPMKTAAHTLASTAWASSLLLNLGPFMRYDGYHLLCDLLDEPDMQPRSFALARWRLREFLFDLGDPAPEPLPSGRRAFFIAYAVAAFVYRILLFLGIAFLVYHLFFKALGVILFAVEISWFVVRPFFVEARVWLRRRGDILRRPRSRFTLGIAALGAVLFFVPLQRSVHAPALYGTEFETALYAPEGGLFVGPALVQGTERIKGAPVYTLEADELVFRFAEAKAGLAAAQAELAGLGFDFDAAGRTLVLKREVERLDAELTRLERRREALTVKAPFSGRIVDPDPAVGPGVPVAAKESPAILIGGPGLVRAYIEEIDLSRASPGDRGLWWPPGGGEPIPVQLEWIEEAAATELLRPEIASPNGGSLEARREADGRVVPERAVHRALLRPVSEQVPPTRRTAGTLVLQGRGASLYDLLIVRALGVLVREQGL